MTNAETWPRWLVQFQDEAPAIGSGWRAVHVAIGRKWVRIFDHCTGRRSRLHVDKWRDVASNAKPLPLLRARKGRRYGQ
jgi:hypothetical protein